MDLSLRPGTQQRPTKSPMRDRPKTPPPSTEDWQVSEATKGNIKVVCRFRPLNDRERAMNLGTCVDFLSDSQTVVVNSTQDQSTGPLKFSYDAVFAPSSAQREVYDYAAKPIVESVLEGFNGTVFAYGQTGSGKTFTMSGPNVDDEVLKGITPRMINTVFDTIRSAPEDIEFSVKVGYLEIYMEKIKDLLEPSSSNLKIHEDKTRGVYIAGLTEEYVATEDEVYSLMKLGSRNREVGATLMNEGSSRSHSLFLMTVAQSNVRDLSAKTGKLYLIDLAGSEKVGKTGAEGKRLDEAKNINKSLSTLGQVIYALTDGKSTHVPYRDSKLTRVLQDSLGGNSKTALIVTCSPSPYNEAETVSTLRFGIRAKAIKNKPKINREYTTAELKLLLANAEADNARKAAAIEALKRKVIELGGSPLSEAELAVGKDAESTLKTASPELEELTAEMDALRDKLEEERKANAELTREILFLTDSDAKLKGEIEKLQLELTTAQLKYGSVDDMMQNKDDEIEQLKKEVKNVEETLATVNAQKVALETQNSELQAAVASMPAVEEVITLTSRMSATRLKEELEIKEIQAKQMRARLELQEAVLQKIETSTGNVKTIQMIQQYRSADSNQIISAQEQLVQERERNKQLTEEVERLSQQITALLTNKIPNYEEIRKLAVAKELAKWENERKLLLKDLQNRINKAVQLEIDLDEAQESYRVLLRNSSVGDPRMKLKLTELQRDKEQLTAMYQSTLKEKSLLSSTVDTQKHKLSRLEERLKSTEVQLGKSLQDVAEKNTRIESLERMCEAVGSRSIRTLSISHNIKKRIRGGGKHITEKGRASEMPFEVAPEDNRDGRMSESHSLDTSP